MRSRLSITIAVPECHGLGTIANAVATTKILHQATLTELTQSRVDVGND
jgi:hypothetical protein